MGTSRWTQIFPEITYDQKPPDEPLPCPRHTSHSISPKVRLKSNVEVVTGLEPEEAREEASRCLRCDIRTHVSCS
jgi:hypothetical protein